MQIKKIFSDFKVNIKKIAIVIMYELVDELKQNAQKIFEKSNAKSSKESFKQGK